MARRLMCSMLLLLALAAGSAAAQDAAASPSPVRDYLGMPSPSAPGVEVQAWFPSHPRLQFPLGETVDVVVGFSNSGEEAYNVSAIQGSLHSAAQWNLWVQNFTLALQNLSLKPGEQGSLQYKFKPDRMLQPREFLVALHVFYNGLATPHHSLAFNKTVDIIELPKLVDFELIGLYGIMFAVLAAIGYAVYRQLQGVGWVRAATKRRVPRGGASTAGAQDPSQWLKGTYYDTHARAKAKRAGSTGLGATGDVTKKAM
jgi:hypothetical protein